jgi:DNA (cytosine-5)-methyltransferase 1
MALDRLKQNFPDFDYELIGWSEIDKYAIQAHNAVYPQYSQCNYGDITKIDWEQVPDFDLFTYSSPCQDFSQAGKQQGGTKGSGTRSSLLWECEKAIINKRPKYLLMENVPALVSSKFIKLFNAWQKTLEGYGYRNFGKVLNAKDYGVPQNRERIFLLSIRDDGDNPTFNFPKTIKLEKRLKDILETNVDEKYYLKEDRIEGFDGKRISKHQWGIVKRPDDISNAIMSSDYKDAPKVAESVVLGWTRDSEGNIIDRHPVDVANCVTSGKRENTQNYVVEPQIVAMRGREPQVMTPKRTEYGKSIRKQYEAGEIQEQRKNIQQLEPRTDGVSNTLTSVQKDNLVMEPMIYDDYNGRLRDDQDTCGTLTTNCGNEAPRNGFKIIEPINTDEEGNASTLTAGYYKYGSKTLLGDTFGTSGTAVKESGYRIRKLTERECFRLMDVPEEYIDIIQQSGVSRSQQYKMAGNSIVVSCLYHIFRKAFIETENENLQLTLF